MATVLIVIHRGSGTHRSSKSAVAATPPRPWKVALDAVTQPAPVDGRFVVYAANGGKLELVGLDATTGRVAWTVPASPSAIAPGTSPEVAIVGNRVIYLSEVSGPLASVVAANAATGAAIWRSPAGEFSGWPAVCPDAATAVCVSGALQGSSTGVLRLDALTGRSLPSPQIGPGARELADNLFDPGERHPEVLVSTKGSDVAWQQPLQRIFTVAGASTDYGWSFDRVPRLGMYVGSVGTPPLVETQTHFAFDMSKAMTAAFRMSDGSAVWRDRGSQYLCGYLTCAGAGDATYSSPGDAQDSGPTVGIRLRAHGVLSGSPTAIAPTASSNSGGILEGFDLATGHVRWRFDFGRDVGLLTQTELPPRVSAQTIVLRRAGRLVALDVASGATSPVAATTTAWCSKIVSYHMTIPYQAGGHSVHEYVGQYAITPCTPSGRPTTAPTQGLAAMNGVLAATQGEFAWMEQGAVVGVPA